MRYYVQLSARMLIALADIHNKYDGEDSPRRDMRTVTALHNRKLVTLEGHTLTQKGRAYLEMALYEYAKAQRWIADLAEERAAA